MKPILMIWALAVLFPARQKAEEIPRFENYKVTADFAGTPAAPLLRTPLQRMYRTMIRQGVAKGWGVFRDGKEKVGPNFAGHYIVVQWGCGTSCVMMVIVDALTGKIYDIPLGFGREGGQRIVLPMLGLSPAEVTFRLTSRLWKMNACPDQPYNEHGLCYAYYYVWQDYDWRLLRRVRLEDHPF